MNHTQRSKFARHFLVAVFAGLYSTSVSAQPPGPVPGTAVEAPALETDPAVRAALELPRDTPADHFQAIIWLIDLGRPVLAKPILEELAKLQLTAEQRAALVAEFGSRDMLRLARAKELAPAGAAFADACTAAAAAAANDPQRIAALVAQLTDPSAEVRQMARADLAATGQTGVIAALEALAREPNADRRALLVAAAAEMHPLVVGPLLAMLDSNDPLLRADVAQLLEYLNVVQAIPLLESNSAAAERALTTAIENYRQGTPPFVADEQGQVELWYWNDVEKKLGSLEYPAEQAKTIWMARLAIRRSRLVPQDAEYQREAMILALEADDVTRNPSGVPLAAVNTFAFLEEAQALAAGADTAMVNDALSTALEANYARAAAALIFDLEMRGDASLLFTADAQPSPLAAALGHANRWVRFAALRAIMTLDPASPYPGSSRVPEALAWFAGSTGERHALVAMPTYAASTHLAGMLAAHDLDAQATNRGRDAVDLARKMADLEMIFVDMDIQAPGIRQVIYELRISPTTGEVPIALLAAEGRLKAAERLAAEHDRVIAVPRPHSDAVLARIVARLSMLADRDPASPEERSAQAADAQAWLEQLAATRPFYTIRRTAPRAMPTALRGHAKPATSMATQSSGHATQP